VTLEAVGKEAEKQAAAKAAQEELARLETLASLYPLPQTPSAATAAPILTTLLGAAALLPDIVKSLAVGHTMQPEPAEMQPVPSPPGYRRLAVAPFAVGKEANRLKDNGVFKSPANPNGLTVGSYLVRQFNGKFFVFLVEWHKHPPTDKVSDGLKKPHPGFSIFEKKT
jgi:hypothetical protein